MGLMKASRDILENSQRYNEKYEIASFLIKSEMIKYYDDLDLKERREWYSQRISYYAKKYGLRKRKLGHFISVRHTEPKNPLDFTDAMS